jgi:hypothetical protein
MTLGATGVHARWAQLRFFVGQDAEAGAPYPSDYPPGQVCDDTPSVPQGYQDLSMSLAHSALASADTRGIPLLLLPSSNAQKLSNRREELEHHPMKLGEEMLSYCTPQ